MRPRSPLRRMARAVCLALGLAVWAAPAPASAPAAGPLDPREALAAQCEAAAVAAARAEGVPEALLRAVALAESGRRLNGRLRPWPWTVNMEGEGRWFDDPATLLNWVRGRQAQGARSFDLGCFQVNHLWHGQAFEGLEDMLDPQISARYAARFLRELHDQSGSWETAAGHYHSRTPALAERYRARVLSLMAGLSDVPPPPVLAPAPPRRARALGGPLIDFGAPSPGAAPAGSLAGPLLAAAGPGLLRAARPLFGPGAARP